MDPRGNYRGQALDPRGHPRQDSPFSVAEPSFVVVVVVVAAAVLGAVLVVAVVDLDSLPVDNWA